MTTLRERLDAALKKKKWLVASRFDILEIFMPIIESELAEMREALIARMQDANDKAFNHYTKVGLQKAISIVRSCRALHPDKKDAGNVL